MDRHDWDTIIQGELTRLRQVHLYRHRRVVRSIDAAHAQIDGRQFVNFASNDYLGLTRHPKVAGAIQLAVQRDGFGSGASPLISGHTPAHASAERTIAAWKRTGGAVLLPSGYQANLAAVQLLSTAGRLAGGGVRFLLDKLCHASLIDAVRGVSTAPSAAGALTGGGNPPDRPSRRESAGEGTGCTGERHPGLSGTTGGPAFRVFPHNDMGKLDRLLRDADPRQTQVVVTESIFSMDGDAADLAGLAEIKGRYPFLLLLDEAHASGVYGPGGSGLAAERGMSGLADVVVVTFSKALGGVGAAVCASAALCDLLVNSARPFIFSTAVPSCVAAAAETAIGVLHEEPARQQRVRRLALDVRKDLTEAGFEIPIGDSPIIPVVMGSEQSAMQAAERLGEEGLLVLPIRPPTVPRGSSRLRITLSCEHSDEDVRKLIRAVASAIRSIGNRPGPA